MTLLRSYGQVDEDGKISLGRNFMLQMGLGPDSLLGLKVIRITRSGREPYLIIHRLDNEPRFTALQTVFYQCPCRIDEESRIVLDDKAMAEAGFEPGLSLEFKLAGPSNAPWLAIRNKGQARLTTLQERVGLKQKSKWQVMKIEY